MEDKKLGLNKEGAAPENLESFDGHEMPPVSVEHGITENQESLDLDKDIEQPFKQAAGKVLPFNAKEAPAPVQRQDSPAMGQAQESATLEYIKSLSPDKHESLQDAIASFLNNDAKSDPSDLNAAVIEDNKAAMEEDLRDAA